MSWQATDAVMRLFERKSVEPREYLLLLAMAHSYNEKRGDSHPKRQTLAKRTGVSERHVTTLAKRLINAGDIFVIKPGRGRGNSTAYGLAQKYVEKKGNTFGSRFNGENGKCDLIKREQPTYGNDPQRINPQRREQAALDNSVPSRANGPPLASSSKILSFIPSAPLAPAENERPWRQELRDRYPGVTDAEIIRVETNACKGKPTRSWMLNIFKKNPPGKMGAPKKSTPKPKYRSPVIHVSKETEERGKQTARELRTWRLKQLPQCHDANQLCQRDSAI